MVEVDVVLTNSSGLHARPAAQFVQAASRYKGSVIKISTNGREIDARSIIGVMSLGAKQGAVLTIRAEGPDEIEIVQVLKDLVETGFGERTC